MYKYLFMPTTPLGICDGGWVWCEDTLPNGQTRTVKHWYTQIKEVK